MIGLAEMCFRLADERAFPDMAPSLPLSQLRPRADLVDYLAASTEYYRIIDRLSRGEQP
jgi:hypothetical protein